VRLLAGRVFSDADNLPGRNVVVIDDILASKAFHGQPAVGNRILIRLRTPEPEWVEVIGVVAHQHAVSLTAAGREQVFFTDAFAGSGAVDSWAIRTGNDPTNYGSAVRAAVKEVDSHLLVSEMQPVDALVLHAQAGTRFSLVLISVFAIIAGVLAGVGLYGVLATAVRQRTAEIGVRMALGAAPDNIFQLVVGQGLRLSAIGVAAGLGGAFLLTRLMSAMLVGVHPTDPATFAVVAILFFSVAALASWLPARRAAALDPARALREE
jgi:putative ABC transport system permease protein